MPTHRLSRVALERLQAEHLDLTTRGRIEVAARIGRAREMGDLKENGDYHAAKDDQGHMEGRIRIGCSVAGGQSRHLGYLRCPQWHIDRKCGARRSQQLT